MEDKYGYYVREIIESYYDGVDFSNATLNKEDIECLLLNVEDLYLKLKQDLGEDLAGI